MIVVTNMRIQKNDLHLIHFDLKRRTHLANAWSLGALVALMLFCANPVSYGQGQHVQWASRVIDFSSQRSPKEYSAQQVLGRPNKFPDAGDSPCAWASAHDGPEGGGEERLRVGFAHPMQIRQVAIVESFNPGSVERVVIYDTAGKSQIVFEGKAKSVAEASRIMHVTFALTKTPIAEVEIFLDCGKVEGWNEIDAIGISSEATPVLVAVNVVPNMPKNLTRENLGPAVNSAFDEVLPVISPDGKSIFFDRNNHPENIGSHDNIWFSEQNVDSSWTPAKNIGAPLNNGYGSFVASITPDGNTLLLGGTYIEKGVDVFGIWLSHRDKRGWAYPQHVRVKNFYTNSRFIEFCLSSDSRTLLISLEREQGFGRKDLYASFLEATGEWSEPKNLGPVVNSAADEGMPFLAADGTSLYYSSEGFSGYGGMDMYVTRRLDDSWEKWSEPQNLGPALNSAGWDAYYTIPASGEYAFFVSTEGSIGQGDVFRVKLPESLRPNPVALIAGRVLDSSTHKPIEASVHFERLPKSKEAGTASSNPTTGSYKIVLPVGALYGFRAEAPGYLSVSQNVDLRKVRTYQELEQDLMLVPISAGRSLPLNNIFFDFGKATLQAESFVELDHLAEELLANPSAAIEIGGHTDNLGTQEINQKLSLARADAVGDYLKHKGLEAKRVSTHGYASTKPVASNDTEEGRQKNRRVEITVTK
jgi:OOP family OmpA-OmpF porin